MKNLQSIYVLILATCLILDACSTESEPTPTGVIPGQVPGVVPGQVPGVVPGQVPGQVPGVVPGQIPGVVPGQIPGVVPGQVPVQPTAPTQPTAPSGIPGMPNLQGLLTGQPATGGAKTIPWQSLSQALPTKVPGWVLEGQVTGESVNVMGISSSNASCSLKQGAMIATVDIVDVSLNPMLAMPFNMMRAVQIDSSTERRNPISYGEHPGSLSLNKGSNSAEVIILVRNRIMITVSVSNTNTEQTASQVAQYINFNHLVSLIGG